MSIIGPVSLDVKVLHEAYDRKAGYQFSFESPVRVKKAFRIKHAKFPADVWSGLARPGPQPIVQMLQYEAEPLTTPHQKAPQALTEGVSPGAVRIPANP